MNTKMLAALFAITNAITIKPIEERPNLVQLIQSASSSKEQLDLINLAQLDVQEQVLLAQAVADGQLQLNDWLEDCMEDPFFRIFCGLFICFDEDGC